jgi:hypothetical protein
LSVKVTPVGRVPLSPIVADGNPLEVTENVPPLPTVNVVVAAEVIVELWLTVRVKLWVASDPIPFDAVIATGYVPPVPAAGVPESSPPEESVTPDGRAPVSVIVGAG